MIRLIITVILCVLSAGLAAWLALNPGTATVDFLGQQYSFPFAGAMGLWIVVTFILVALWWLIVKVWTAPDVFRRFQKRRRRESGFDALERALIAAAAGDGELAVRQAARADAMLDRPALSSLLAARAAEAAGDLPAAETYYEAMLENPKTRLVAQRGLASIAETRGDTLLAISHSSEAFSSSKKARWAFESLFNAQVAEARWEDGLKTLRDGEKAGHITPDRASRRRAVMLTAQARTMMESAPGKAADLADQACTASPAFAPGVALAADLLAQRRRHRRAADLIEAAWQIAPHPAIARVYGDLRKSDSRVKRAERLRALAKLNPEHRESRLLTADVSLDQRNIEAARTALAPLLGEGRLSARVCVLAARLNRLEGDEDEARRLMARAAHAPGEADWSDIDAEGQAFPYDDEDWKRMVYTWGDEARLIHPRYERFEIAAEAIPTTALLEAPSAKRVKLTAGEDEDEKTDGDNDAGGPSYVELMRAPDDPGTDDDKDKT